MKASTELLAALALRYVAAREAAGKAWAEYRHRREDERLLRIYTRKLRHCERLRQLVTRISAEP